MTSMEQDEGFRRFVGDDPCDEMLTTKQAILFAFNRWEYGFDDLNVYDYLTILWGVTRDEAKRRCYRYSYSGAPMVRTLAGRVREYHPLIQQL